VENVAERDLLAIVRGPRQHSEKSLEMKVYRDVDIHILKPEITGKQVEKLPKNAKNSNLLKHKKVLNTEI